MHSPDTKCQCTHAFDVHWSVSQRCHVRNCKCEGFKLPAMQMPLLDAPQVFVFDKCEPNDVQAGYWDWILRGGTSYITLPFRPDRLDLQLTAGETFGAMLAANPEVVAVVWLTPETEKNRARGEQSETESLLRQSVNIADAKRLRDLFPGAPKCIVCGDNPDAEYCSGCGYREDRARAAAAAPQTPTPAPKIAPRAKSASRCTYSTREAFQFSLDTVLDSLAARGEQWDKASIQGAVSTIFISMTKGKAVDLRPEVSDDAGPF